MKSNDTQILGALGNFLLYQETKTNTARKSQDFLQIFNIYISLILLIFCSEQFHNKIAKHVTGRVLEVVAEYRLYHSSSNMTHKAHIHMKR